MPDIGGGFGGDRGVNETGLIIRRAVRRTKRLLLSAGLLAQPPLDFSNRLTSAKHVDGMLARIADVVEGWLSKQAILPDLGPIDVRREVRDFYAAYLSSPFRETAGGSRFNKLLWLALLAKALRPTLVIDSGTYRGASAWALSLGAPDATILSFDIDLSRLQLRQPNCEYFQYDWSRHDLASFDLSRSLCYFDDLVDQVRRLLEAKARRIPFAIFSDDYPVSCFANATPSPARLPKLEFIDDPSLEHGDVLEWTWREAPRRWIVDQRYLAQGRAAIKAAERLPDLGTITGIRVLSPKVVAL
jgi:hypothetical protein